MLAKLFNNISIQSLVRALLFSLLCLGLLLSFGGYHAGHLQILSWEWVVPAQVFAILFIGVNLFTAWWFNSVVNLLGFLKNDFQLLPVYILVLAPLLAMSHSVELLLILPLGVFLMLRLLNLMQSVDPSYILYDTGVVCALMILLAPGSLIFLLIIWLAALNFGHLNFRTFLMPIIGMTAIYFMLFTILYWIFHFDGITYLLADFKSVIPVFHYDDFHKAWVYIPLVIVAIPAFLETAQTYGKASVLKRQVFTFLTLFFLIMAVAGAFVQNGVQIWMWLAVPLSVFVVNRLHYQRKNWQKDISYLLLLIFLAMTLFA